jgi:hypothetical protein
MGWLQTTKKPAPADRAGEGWFVGSGGSTNATVLPRPVVSRHEGVTSAGQSGSLLRLRHLAPVVLHDVGVGIKTTGLVARPPPLTNVTDTLTIKLSFKIRLWFVRIN